jgi:malonyl CoA-acyl carrier protein transacylase
MAEVGTGVALIRELGWGMAAAGAEAIVEFGPGRTLTGLAKKTVPGVMTLNVQDAESLEETMRALNSTGGPYGGHE